MVTKALRQKRWSACFPSCWKAQVRMVEQPFPVGQEVWLDGFECAVPIAADESAQGLTDITRWQAAFG